MIDTREQLADLFVRFLAQGTPGGAYGYADEAIALVHRSLVEVCCARVVVTSLRALLGRPRLHSEAAYASIPIAQTIEPLAVEVAVELADGFCHVLYRAQDRVLCARADRACADCDGTGPIRHPFSFAASYYDGGGVRTYVLASGECDVCGGIGYHPPGMCGGHIIDPDGCDTCSGTGSRTDMRQIADRYQPDRPWRDEDTPRLARFEVRR